MTELVNIVRTADALLMARTQLDDAARTGSGWLFKERRADAATKLLAQAGSATDRALELAGGAPAASGTGPASAIVDAQAAVGALQATMPGQARDLRAAGAPARTALIEAHARVVAGIDDATAPTDAQVAATWTRAAKLVREGVELPPYLRDTARADVDATRAAAAELASKVMRPRIDEMTATDLLHLSRLVRASRDVVPSLPALTERQARQLERASRLVEQGIELPTNWSLRPALEESRGRTIWRTLGDARDHARELLWGPKHELTPEQVDDLRAIARLPEELRPDAFPNGLPAGPIPDELLREMRSGFADAKTIELVRSHLHRVSTAFAQKLSTPQENYRDVLGPLRDELVRFQDLPLEAADRTLAAGALELVERNIARQEGRLSGQYGRWTDLAELGRVKANMETIDGFAGARQTAAEAAERAASEPTAQVASGAAGDAAGAAPTGETLTW